MTSDSQHTVRCRSNVATLREALVKRPEEAFGSQAQLDRSWKELGFLERPEFALSCQQHAALRDLLESEGVALHLLPETQGTDADSLYTHDPVTTVGDGLVLCRMGKGNRLAEPSGIQYWARKHRVHVTGSIKAPGMLEGGDLIWLDRSTAAVGLGYRSNLDGAEQLGRMTGITTLPVPLPHWKGPGDVLHLMSLISPIRDDLALVYRRLLPVTFVQELARRGIQTLDVPDEEFETLGCNVLALSPGRCLMVAGNPVTKARLEVAGCTVLTFDGSEIALKGQGGPTCLTRPLVRG